MANAQKTPQARALNEFGRRKALDQIQKTGQSLPCSVVSADGAIITVNFEVQSDFTLPQIDVPLFGPQYIRYPMQPGDFGIVIAVDAQIGPMCGLDDGTADLAQPANLAALVFLPIGNKQWSGVDPDSVTVYGPNGVVLYDTGQNSTISLTPTGIAIATDFVDIESSAAISGGLTVGGGASGTFTTGTGLTVTVQDGIITNIF